MSLNLEITPYQIGDNPLVKKLTHKLLESLGEEGVRDMINKHYGLLKISSIKHLFPVHNEKAFELAKKHSADFFIQLSGGPNYFEQNRGAPKMRQRHAKFQIDANARVIWLECFKTVVEDLDMSDEIKQDFWDYLNPFSAWMINS